MKEMRWLWVLLSAVSDVLTLDVYSTHVRFIGVVGAREEPHLRPLTEAGGAKVLSI